MNECQGKPVQNLQSCTFLLLNKMEHNKANYSKKKFIESKKTLKESRKNEGDNEKSKCLLENNEHEIFKWKPDASPKEEVSKYQVNLVRNVSRYTKHQTRKRIQPNV